MPADAYVMDSDMKQVADAIRKVSGIDKMLLFPKDFVAEINKLVPKPPVVYGVRIKIDDSRPNDAVEYIDDAVGFTPMTRNSAGSWEGNELISGIKPVARMSDGTWKDLDKRNLANGADVTGEGVDVFTRFPTWWLSISTDATYNYIRFSNEKKDDSYFKLASLYNGVDQGMFHLGCYHAYFSGYSSQLRSVADKQPSVNRSSESFRQLAQARGTGFDQVGWYQIMYLQALFTVLFKGRNGQELIGKGIRGVDIQILYEDRVNYDNDYGMAGNSDGTEQMSFFWINNFWGNVYDFIGGAKTDGSKKLMTLENGEPLNTNRGGWVVQTESSQMSKGNPSKMDMRSTKSGFFPMESSNPSYTEYWCGGSGIMGTESRFPRFGTSILIGEGNPFECNFNSSSSFSDNYTGSRLCYRKVVN